MLSIPLLSPTLVVQADSFNDAREYHKQIYVHKRCDVTGGINYHQLEGGIWIQSIAQTSMVAWDNAGDGNQV